MPLPPRVTHALARLRHLASLDCGGPESIGPVLCELRHLIGFDLGAYFHAGADGALDAHVEDDAMLDPLSAHFDPVVLRSDDYDRVMRLGNVADWLSLALRAPQGPAIGMLLLFRPPGSRPFSSSEVAQLARLEQGLARMLRPHDLPADDSEVLRDALLIASPVGRPLWLSLEAESLLALAFGWRCTNGGRCRRHCSCWRSACAGRLRHRGWRLRRKWKCATPTDRSCCALRRCRRLRGRAKPWPGTASSA